MPSSRSAVASILLLSSVVYALPEISIQKRDKHTNGRTQDVARGMIKRSGTLETTVYDILTYSTGGAYYANITVGTPAQEQVVIVDTGSSDLYFDASTAASCDSTGLHSCRGGTFDPKNSSTYSVVEPSPAFNTSFGDGSTATGPFGKDVVGISDITISGVQFGVADQVVSKAGFAIGLMGVGYSQNEATSHKYPNIPEVLRDAGVINSRLYSVYLNEAEATSGSILFGGIDTSKYTGTLQTVDILPSLITKDIDQFITTVTALTVNVDGTNKKIFAGGKPGVQAYQGHNPALPTLLDTGSAAWIVPPAYYKAITEAFPYVNANQGTCSCAHRYSSDTMTLTFEGVIDITVPASDFIIPAYHPQNNQPYTLANGEEECVFMLQPLTSTGEGFWVAGDAILRSMYIVYDLDNGQMSLAQSHVNSTSTSDIRAVPAGLGGVAKVADNVKSTPSPSYRVAPEINGTAKFTVGKATTTVGAATGDPVPNNAQAGVSAAASTSKGSGVPMTVPGMDWSGVWVSGIALVMAALGAGLVL